MKNKKKYFKSKKQKPLTKKESAELSALNLKSVLDGIGPMSEKNADHLQDLMNKEAKRQGYTVSGEMTDAERRKRGGFFQ